MKPTKKIEAAVLDVYHKWLHSYLNGDVKTYDSYFDNSFHFIGSTNNEEFLTRKDTTNFFKATAEQLAGKTQLRNETKIIEQFGELVFITHLFDAWFLNGNDWSFYGRFRFSNILEQNEDGWHFVYQHYSTPDSKAQDGETIGFNQITKENLELREAIQRRTVELEEKNKELEIEGSLERIRAKALAMTSSEDLLDVVVNLRTEFLKLGHEAHYFWHMMWLPDKYEKAMTSGDGTRIGMVMELPRHIHGEIPLLANWEKSTNPMVIYTMDAESAIDYVDKMITLGDFKQVDPQAPTHDDIRHIGGLTFIMARTTHGEIGYSLPGVVENPPKEDLQILVKFAGAFDLAHRRFLDLQKAEKQRREVEIALALEKVRSRTMGMQRSDELRDTAMLLFQQIEELGINSFACGFNIWDDDKKVATAWMASTYGLQPPFKTNSAEDVYLLFFEAEKRGESLFILEQKGKELEDHYKYLKTIPEVKNLSDAGVSFPTYQIIHCAYFSKGYLMFITLEPVPDAHDIFKRFAKVFEQTYTRFLDLQKAEAQTREAQIEAALERVRSRTMAMQNSTELADTAIDMFKQMQTLGIRPWACGFNIFEKDEKAVTQWMSAVDGALQPPFTTPLTENPFFIKIFEARQRGEELFVMESGGQELEETYTYMFNLPSSKKALGNILASGFEMPKFQISHCAFFSQGYLMFITYEPYPEAHDVFKRFAKVFEQTYTRFLDLQKAEAQAREAQIEAALERVRAQSNAMHKSEDLANVVTAVYEELRLLNSKILRCGIGIINEKLKNVNTWITSDLSSGTSIELSGNEPLSGHPLLDSIFDHWTKQKNLSYVLEGKDLIEYYQTVIKTDFQKHFAKEGLDNANVKQYYHCTMFATGGLFVFESSPISKEQINVLQRFTDAFNRAYTRHQDLQKAEAQAREAQIEAALERVRSRSMAMHKSEELIQVVRILDKEILGLGIEVDGTQIITDFADTEKGVNDWFAREGQDFLEKFHIPYINHSLTERADNEIKKGIDFYTDSYSKDEKNEYFKLLFKYSDFRTYPKKSQDLIYNAPGWSRAIVLSKNSILIFQRFDLKGYSKEEQEIFKRFGKVFEQSYTRFLDLQKAEAQAREAQIEGALEKVRSRTMAMQKSEELPDAANVLFTEVQKLGIPAWSCGYNILSDDKKSSTCIMSSEGEIQSPFILPLTKHKSLKPWHKAILNNENFYVYEQGGKDLEEHYNYMRSLPNLKETFQQLKDAKISLPTFQVNHLAKFTNGFLLFITYERVPESHDIFQRFAKVFQQTYTRFLDLQKAEKQARESQIEGALERVRSTSLAMHNSEELLAVIEVVSVQLRLLDLKFDTVSFGKNDQEGDFKFWLTSSGQPKPVLIQVPFFDSRVLKSVIEAQKKENDFIADVFTKEENRAWSAHMIQHSALKNFPEHVKDFILNSRGFARSSFLMQHIDLYVGNYRAMPFTDEENAIFKRFAQVFSQAYIRFLDLQKAEVQARESQIELALERVRARTMAMQHSTELNDTSALLFQQIQMLGVPPWSCGINIWEKEDTFFTSYMGSHEGFILNGYKIPLTEEAAFIRFKESRDRGDKLFIDVLEGNALKTHYQYFQTLPGIKEIFEKRAQAGFPIPTYQIHHLANFSHGNLMFITYEHCPEAHDIFIRFARVFEQTYIRFLDLQNAEALARESEIQLALERVRARTMAMQSSEELADTAFILFEQLRNLGGELWGTGFGLCTENSDKDEFWFANKNGVFPPVVIPNTVDPAHKEMYQGWRKKVDFLSIEKSGKALKQHYNYMLSNAEVSPFFQKIMDEGLQLPERQQWNAAYFSKGYLLIITIEPYPDVEILKRFAKVFNQTYTRFLDLKKAEAQTREAQIEAALEKVRSRTMAMQKGEEVKDVVVLLYKELIALGVTNFASCGYVEINEETQLQSTWVTSPGGDSLGLFYLPLTGDVHFDARYKAWKKQQTVFHQTVAGKERKKHLEYAITTFNSKEAEEMVLTQFPDPTIFYCFNFSHGYLHVVAGSLLTEDEEALLARFTKVFEQTYARFLDLEKAEAQTREAQINLAVERVRAKALAMHKSEEIIELVAKLKNEVMSLDIPDVVAATIFLHEGDDKVRMWDLSSLEDEDNYSEVPFDITFKLKKSDPNFYVKRVWENPENYFVEIQDEKDFKRLILWLREQNKNEIADEVEDFIEKIQLKHLYHSAKKLNNGKLVIDQLNPPSDEMETILTKMGAAFDLAYKRFEDLKKAEAQTREAQIEAALEKVRSRSLAMHKPDELQEVVAVVAEKLKELGVIFDAGGVILCTYFPDNKDVVHWIAVDDFSTSGRYFMPYFDNPIFSEAWDSKNRGDIYFSKEFPVKAKNDFFKQAFENSDYSQMPDDYKQFVLAADTHHLSAAWSKNSAIIIPSLTGAVPSESNAEIIKRFANVFEQAYIRFMDLQKAEERARETQIDIALERVRSRTLEMQTSDELAETSMVVFQQLVALGIAPNRLFIGIIKDKGASIEAWATNEDGKKIDSRFTLQASKNKSIKKIITGWEQHKKSLVIDMKGKELQDYFQYLNKEMNIPFIDGLEQKRRVQTLAYFSEGLIGMAAPVEQSENSIRLLERFAAVFNLTYTRFKDLKIAEANAEKAEQDLIKLHAAKKSAEEALTELQLTQTQLIQSEKMASLGELTAGIAHEIQNPLNFVNNFSEVSNELIDEMNEELEKGDLEEAKAISLDIKQNLEKINHHGKRADAIVKGMLQHSRSSTGKKELTDINALTDEYLRLAYHGLRAKDKGFNATLETDFDENMDSVNVIPQDIGRVILNLITNAFYAVNEKKKLGVEGYNPTISINTKKKADTIEINVRDNGGGIPQKVLDKVFQPFFTTKPTGQGTGLGLSMSYDIITKGHSGKLNIETKEGEGSKFSILLPIDN